MHKSVLRILSVLFCLVYVIHGNSLGQSELSSASKITFLKPKASTIRLNPLKYFFTVVYNPSTTPQYSIEWNLPFLRTMLLESTHVSDEDKTLFLMKFSNIENDYADWSDEQHDQLERFTEKYFSLYKSPDSFLPFLDCPALTYALMDEKLNSLQSNIDEEKRFKVRAKAVQHLCESD